MISWGSHMVVVTWRWNSVTLIGSIQHPNCGAPLGWGIMMHPSQQKTRCNRANTHTHTPANVCVCVCVIVYVGWQANHPANLKKIHWAPREIFSPIGFTTQVLIGRDEFLCFCLFWVVTWTPKNHFRPTRGTWNWAAFCGSFLGAEHSALINGL